MSVMVPSNVGRLFLVMSLPPLVSLAGSSTKLDLTIAGGWVSIVKVTWKSLPGTLSAPEGRGNWLPLESRFVPSRASPLLSRMTEEPVPLRMIRYSSLAVAVEVKIPEVSTVRMSVAGLNDSLPERLIVRSDGLLPLPKMPSPPEAWRMTDIPLMVDWLSCSLNLNWIDVGRVLVPPIPPTV